MKLIHIFSVIAITVTFTSLSLNAEERPPARAKIGLVLAGGGALGCAHVGVLKVLEELRIPVEIVTGTSMGAIVGAAYASGVPVERMEKTLIETHWNEVFSESPPRADVVYRLKGGRDREIFGETIIGIKDGKLVNPMGLISGQHVLPLLQGLYINSVPPTEFDAFPLRFRAVTADLETGKAVVFDKGDLAKIVRASMSVPGVFAPVEIDGKLLVDGGIANNLPVDIAKNLGAEQLIVVELYADLAKKEDLTGPLAISGQILSLLLAQNAEIQRGYMTPRDVLVAPNLTGYTPTDFDKAKELIALGEAAAREAIPRLRHLSVSEAEYVRFKSRREKTREEDLIQFVKIENHSNLPDGFIERVIKAQKGQVLNRAEIEQDVRRIYGTGYFSSVTYSYETRDGEKGLVYSVRGKEWLEQYVRVGASIELDSDGDTSLGLAGNYHLNGINSWGAEWDVEAEVGDNPRLFTEFYQPLGEGSPYFIAPRAAIGRTQLLIREDGESIAEYRRSEMGGGLFFGRELGNLGEVRLGLNRGTAKLERDIGETSLPEFDYEISDAIAKFTIDTLDTPDFPSSGILFLGEYLSSVEELGASDSFDQLTSNFNLPYTWGRSTLSFSTSIGQTFGTRPVERSFVHGGFIDFSGYPRNSLNSSDFMIGRLGYYRRFSEVTLPVFGLGFYAGGTFELGNFTQDSATLGDEGTIAAGSVFLGADTPIVPIYLGLGWAEQGEVTGYLAFGRINPRKR